MGTLVAGLDSLILHEPIFKDVKYYLSGEVPEKITELLRAGGGEQTKYFSDFVSHLICGPGAPETDLTDASDLYEIPAATFHWVVACVRLKKIVSTKPYNPSRYQLFSGVVACLARVSPRDAKTLFALVTFYGGRAKLSLGSDCTHLICGTASGSKYSSAGNVSHDKLKVVTPDWVTESIKAKIQCAHDAYHPRLLKPPPVVVAPSSYSSDSRISSITGFDFEEGIAKSEVPTQSMSDNKDLESTQALLDKLKQRMPWNHPAPVTSTVASIPPVTKATLSGQQYGPPGAQLQGASGPQTMSAIQIQQQRILQQHQLRMQIQMQQQNKAPGMVQGLAQSQGPPLSHPQNINMTQQSSGLNTSVNQLMNHGHPLHQKQLSGPNINQQGLLLNQKVHGPLGNPQQQGIVGNQAQGLSQQMNQNIPVSQSVAAQQQGHSLVQMPQHQGPSHPNSQGIIVSSQQSHLLSQQSLAAGQQGLAGQQQTLSANILSQQQHQNMSSLSAQTSSPNVSISQQQQQQVHTINQQLHSQPPNISNIATQNWRQQQINQQQQNLLSQNSPQNSQQIVRGPMLQQRTQLQQNQMLLQQQMLQNQNLLNSHQQQPGQHGMIAQQNPQLIQQSGAQQLQSIQGGQQQVLVQKQLQQGGQQILGQQQINSNQQQIIINQQQGGGGGHPQILVQGNQHMSLQSGQITAQRNSQILAQAGQQEGQQILSQGGQQIIQSQGQIIPQSGQQIITQGGQQIITQGNQLNQGGPQMQQVLQGQTQQVITHQGGKQIMTQGGQQIIAQSGQQLMTQGGQQLMSQGGQQIMSQGGQQIVAQGGQQILSQGGQQIMTQGGQQIITQGQQILTPGGQQIIGQGGQQIISQGGQQIISQGGQQMMAQGGQQIMSQGGQQIMTQGGQQIMTQGGQQIMTQGGQILAQGGQQIMGQSGQQIIAQGGQQIIAQGGQQIITQGGQQIITQGGQQMINWQQQQQFLQQRQQQLITGQPGAVSPRVSWGAGSGGRQLIHLDAQTHAQLQQMDPQQRALFVAQLQKRRQLSVQRAAAQQVTLVRGHSGAGPQVQWVQGAGTQRPPAEPASAAQQQRQQYAQLQLQRHQQYQQLQRLQAQREQKQAIQGAAVAGAGVGGAGGVAGARVEPPSPEAASVPQGPPADQQVLQAGGAPPLVVNARTKTALANMLSIRLQGTQGPPGLGPDTPEPSAAGTLRLMTAAHNAPPRAPAEAVQGLQQRRPPPPPAALLHPQLPASPHQQYRAAAPPAVPAPPPAPRAQFYGHNPNLKLPPHYFLLGCIFHAVDCGEGLVAGWERAVWRHGGEVETCYCARVTHVLAVTQKHGVVMQALRDAKRCVTAYWLSDTMLRRQVTPPWQALHLPLMYAQHERPAARHRASLSGFSGEERQRVRLMLQHTGSKVTSYMSRDNTVLVCRRPEGVKYQRARDWGIPVVSAQWVTDLLLGNMSALSQIENAKYQQFNVANPFRMDYTLVPHLMNAWKMPINITQESHERVRRGALPAPPGPRRAPKRPRPSSPSPRPSSPRPAPPCPPRPADLPPPRVLFSSIRDPEPYAQIVRKLGGSVVSGAAEATHLVMGRLVRTPKLVAALVTVSHVLTPAWLDSSERMGRFAHEAEFPLRDERFESEHHCDLPKLLSLGEQRRTLFRGLTFYMTPGVQPGRAVLAHMVELCGGRVDKNRKSLQAIQELHRENPNSYLVLTVPNDLHLVYYLLQAEKKLNIVCSTELVLSSIMRHELQVEQHLVKVD